MTSEMLKELSAIAEQRIETQALRRVVAVATWLISEEFKQKYGWELYQHSGRFSDAIMEKFVNKQTIGDRQ